jgi:hypothetical protein
MDQNEMDQNEKDQNEMDQNEMDQNEKDQNEMDQNEMDQKDLKKACDILLKVLQNVHYSNSLAIRTSSREESENVSEATSGRMS